MPFTEKEILDSLDRITRINVFPNLGLSNYYPANCKMHLFANDKDWAIVFEILNYNKITYAITIDKFYFGNCLIKNKGDNITNIKSNALMYANSELIDPNGIIHKDARFLNIKNKQVQIEHDVTKYTNRGIKGIKFQPVDTTIDIVALTRYLAETEDILLSSTIDDLKIKLPKDIHFMGTIKDWYHEDYISIDNKHDYIGEKPSSYETFQLIAKCLVSKDINLFKPTMKPNTNWRNWPEAGSL